MSSERHLRAGAIRELADDRASAQDRQRAVVHLASCTLCQRYFERLRGRERLRELLEELPTAPALSPPSYQSAFSGAYERLGPLGRALEHDRADAPLLWRELRDHPPARRRLLVRNAPQYRSWGLLELLVVRAAETVDSDLEEAERAAALALEVIESLHRTRGDAAPHPSDLQLLDLRAHTWALIGACRDRRGQDLAAESAFRQAHRLQKQGSGDPIEKGRVCEMQSHYFARRGRRAQARRLLEEAIDGYVRAQDLHQEGKARLQLAELFAESGQPRRAAAELAAAGPLLDPQREPPTIERLRRLQGSLGDSALPSSAGGDAGSGRRPRPSPVH